MKNNLIGFFGTHGVGKTTTCNLLKTMGYAIHTDSVPRAAQKRLGWSELKEVEKSEANLWLMQDTTLEILKERDAKILESGVLTITDRTPIDLVGYASLWAQRRNCNIDAERFKDYIEACREQCKLYGVHINIPLHLSIRFQSQPDRGDEYSREQNQQYMLDFAHSCRNDFTSFQIESLSKEDRAAEAERIIQMHTNEIRDLIDSDGENRAVRSFLVIYGGQLGSANTKTMRYNIKMSGFDGLWPWWANEDMTLTKSGAQAWIRHLFAQEKYANRENRL